MNTNLAIIIIFCVAILSFLIGYSLAPTDMDTLRHSSGVAAPAATGGGGGYGSPAGGGGYGAPAGGGGGYGAPRPQTGGYGAPAGGGYGM
jgi:translation initiation factor IF-2